MCTIHFIFIRFFQHNMRRGFNGNSMPLKFDGIPYKCRQSTHVHQKFIYAYVQQRCVYVAISYPLRLHFPSIVVRDSIFLVPVVVIYSCAHVCTYTGRIVPIEGNKSGIRIHIFLKNSCSGTPKRNTSTSAWVIFLFLSFRLYLNGNSSAAMCRRVCITVPRIFDGLRENRDGIARSL